MTRDQKSFWFEFEAKSSFDLPPGVGIGCGVTEYDYNDALEILDTQVFTSIKRPPFKKVIENVDVRELDQGMVVPNMKAVVYRGIWFPLGYD